MASAAKLGLAGTVGLVLASAASGCAPFDDMGEAAELVQKNGCQIDADCGEGARCRENICVARSSSEQNVLLRITPAYLADGSEPLPIESELQRLDGPTMREFTLPRPVNVSMRVRRGGAPVPAAVRIRLADQLPGTAARRLMVTPSGNEDAVNVVLHSGQRYLARVEPVDTSLPPLVKEFDASRGLVVNFDYPEMLRTRSYRITGVDPVPMLLVRALHPETRRPMSSTAEPDPDGLVTLAFDDLDAPYRLELSPTADTSAEYAAQQSDTGNGCGAGPASPSYHVLSDALPEPDEDDVVPLVLPRVLPPIRYEGTVSLCGNGDAALTPDNAPERLGVSLRSTELLVAQDAEPTPVVATFVTETSATFPEDGGVHEFCAQAFPGQYDVVVNPPPITGSCRPEDNEATCGCGIFAERRSLEPPDADERTTAVSLQLPTMASISGELTTEGMAPVSGATIDADARTTSEGIELGDSDRGITQYNRSSQGTSDADGIFRLPLDVGAYDVTIKPPSESGFAWLVVRDVRIANRSAEFSTSFTMSAPVSVDGTLRYDGGGETVQASLAGAEIRAFSIQEDPDGTRRAVQIGQATADESGSFMLLLAPLQRQGWL